MPQSSMRFIAPVLIVVALLLVGGAVAFKLHSRDQNQAAALQRANAVTQAERAQSALVPVGFARAETTDGVLYGSRWTVTKKCPDAPYCYGLEIVAAEDCPNFLAAQINFAGTIATDVGTSRASAKATKAGRVVELLFPVVLKPAGAATLETVTCN